VSEPRCRTKLIRVVPGVGSPMYHARVHPPDLLYTWLAILARRYYARLHGWLWKEGNLSRSKMGFGR
jgi:hypothetical protein